MQPFIPDAPWTRRQEMPDAFTLNGAIYVVRCAAFPAQGAAFLFGRIGGLEMPIEASADIDTLADFEAAEALAARLGLTAPGQASANS